MRVLKLGSKKRQELRGTQRPSESSVQIRDAPSLGLVNRRGLIADSNKLDIASHHSEVITNSELDLSSMKHSDCSIRQLCFQAE